MGKDKLKFYTYQLDMKILNILAIVILLVLVGLMYLIGYDFLSIYLDYDTGMPMVEAIRKKKVQKAAFEQSGGKGNRDIH